MWIYGMPMPIAIGFTVTQKFIEANRKKIAKVNAMRKNNLEFRKKWYDAVIKGQQEYWEKNRNNPEVIERQGRLTPARIERNKKFAEAGHKACRGRKLSPEHKAKFIAGIIASNKRRALENWLKKAMGFLDSETISWFKDHPELRIPLQELKFARLVLIERKEWFSYYEMCLRETTPEIAYVSQIEKRIVE